MSVPSRPADERIDEVGYYYKSPTDYNKFKMDNSLANQQYTSDCEYNKSSNSGLRQPEFQLNSGYSDPVTEDELIFVDEDGTVKRYFVYGEETASDYYCKNPGVTSREYDSMVPSAQALYCNELGGSISSTEIAISGSQLSQDENLTIYEKNTTGAGAQFTATISNSKFKASLVEVPDWELAQVAAIIVDITDLYGVDYSLTPIYAFDSLSGQQQAAIREKCWYFVNDLYYRYLGRGADKSGINYYGSIVYVILIPCAFPDRICKSWQINDLVVKEIMNSPEGQNYQERLNAGSVVIPEYYPVGQSAGTPSGVQPGYYTSGDKWKALWGTAFFNKSFNASAGGQLVGVSIIDGGESYIVGDTFGVTMLNNQNSSLVEAEFTVSEVNTQGSLRYLKEPICDFVSETTRKVGLEIWNPTITDNNDPNGCANTGNFMGKAIIEGQSEGLVYGSDPYSINSDKATAAVHAGLIGVGDMAEISWYSANSNKISNFSGSTRNGITSYDTGTQITGVISDLDITISGILGNGSWTVTPLDASGSGAKISVRLNASFNVIAVELNVGGRDYRVGDTFKVTSNAVGFQETPAIITVTSVNSVTIPGSCGINLKLNNIITPDVCQNPTEILELSVDRDNPESTIRYYVEKNVELSYVDSSKDRIIDQVQDDDPNSTTDVILQESSSQTLNLFMAEISRLPGVVEYQQYTRKFYSVGGILTPEITQQFEEQFSNEISIRNQVIAVTSECDRADPDKPLPDNDSIDPYTDDRCIYDRDLFYNPGVHGNSLQELWEFLGKPRGFSQGDTGAEISDIVCGRPASEDLYQDNEPDMSDLAGLRVQRWQPCTNTSNGGVSSLGGHFLDIAPCPTSPPITCVNETYETALAVFDKSAEIIFQNGLHKVGDYVVTAKDPQAIIINNKYLELFSSNTVKRPAERTGLEYWVNAANQTVTGTNAIYWPGGEITYQDGTKFVNDYVKQATNDISKNINEYYGSRLGRPAEEGGLDYWVNQYDNYKPFTGTNATFQSGRLFMNDGFETNNQFVVQATNNIAEAINNKYLSLLGRPAEQAGLDYWVSMARSAGIPATINAIDVAASAELSRGGVNRLIIGIDMVYYLIDKGAESNEDRRGGVAKISVGIDRTLEHLEYAGRNELLRGGPISYKKFCESQSTTEISLSWFMGTRMPPWWGNLKLATPSINYASQKADIIYLLNYPLNQANLYKCYSEDNHNSTLKNRFSQEFTISWPEYTGETEPGYELPVYRKFINISWYKKLPGQSAELRAQFKYSNIPDLESHGFKNGAVDDLPDTVDFIFNANLTNISTTLRVEELSKESDDMTYTNAEILAYNYNLFNDISTIFYAEVTVENIPIDRESKSFIPTVGGDTTVANDTLDDGCKFLGSIVKECFDDSIIPIDDDCPVPTEECCDGSMQPIGQCPDTKTCSDGTVVCNDDDCPSNLTCGPILFPSMAETGGTLPNNGQFSVGGIKFNEIGGGTTKTLTNQQVGLTTRNTDGKDYIWFDLDACITIEPAVIDSEVTKGFDNAVAFNNNGTVIVCNAQMRVVAHWHYQFTFTNNTKSSINLFDDWLDWDTPNERKFIAVNKNYYPTSTGNNPSAMSMLYKNEVDWTSGKPQGSLYTGSSRRPLIFPSNVKEVEIFLELRASNDKWGDSDYNPPPDGFRQIDFGTKNQVNAVRVGFSGITDIVKSRKFKIGKFGLSTRTTYTGLALPTNLKDWALVIGGCADAQVYAPIDYSTPGTYLCGDKNSPNWYQCDFSRNGMDLVANETYRLNGVDGQSNGTPAFYGRQCDPAFLGFTGCLTESDVVLTANTTDGSSNFAAEWNDIPVPPNCQGGYKILWYVDGECRSDSESLGDTWKPYKFLSCGSVSEDLSREMTDPTRAYKVECYVVLNNSPYVASVPVNFDWSTANGDAYTYADYTSWAVGREYRRTPCNIDQNIQEGDMWQIVAGYAQCVVQGNSGGDPDPGPDPDIIEPSADITLANWDSDYTNTYTLENGSVQVEFTAVVDNLNDGSYLPTPEPTLISVGLVDREPQRVFNSTEYTWTETFTEPGTYQMEASFRKNYCPPDTTVVTNSCSGKTFILVKDFVTIAVEDQVISNQPTATLLPEVYDGNYTMEGGCAVGTVGSQVGVTLSIELSRGTGIYEWDDARATSGNWNIRSGTTISKRVASARLGDFGSEYGTIVEFLNNGQVVHNS